MEVVNCYYLPPLPGFSRHCHEKEYEFHLFIKSGGIIYNGKHIIKNQNNLLLFSSPGEFHSAETDGDSLTSWYFVNFLASDGDESLIKRVGGLFQEKKYIIVGREIITFFEKMRFLIENKDVFSKNIGSVIIRPGIQ